MIRDAFYKAKAAQKLLQGIQRDERLVFSAEAAKIVKKDTRIPKDFRPGMEKACYDKFNGWVKDHKVCGFEAYRQVGKTPDKCPIMRPTVHIFEEKSADYEYVKTKTRRKFFKLIAMHALMNEDEARLLVVTKFKELFSLC